MIKVNADLSGLGSYIGAVQGIISAIEDPTFKGNFTDHLIGQVKKSFYAETMARAESGDARLRHVFEWGENQSEISNIPLFKLTTSGRAGMKEIGYEFLPSTQFVPLPDFDRYGINPEKIKGLRRHIFQLKALVMETQTSVTIEPTYTKALFIPWEKADDGFITTRKPVTFNPGGRAATGGFAAWWNEWFGTRAHAITAEESKRINKWLTVTSNNQVRWAAGTVVGGEKVGGQFAKGRSVSASYVDAQAAKVKKKVLAEAERMFDPESVGPYED